MMKRFTALLLALLVGLVLLTAAQAEHDYDGLESSAILRQGSRGSEVSRLQKALIDLGYLSGKADGVFGADTADALSAFQIRNGFGGLPGYSGVATLFTQAALYGKNAVSAGSQGSIGGVANGAYGLRSVSVRTLGQTSCGFNFTNEGDRPIEAICFIYWLADANNRVVTIDGENYVTHILHGLSLQPGVTMGITASIPATEKELKRASSLRFIVAEIAYDTGAVYVDFDATLSPYENDYYLAAKWN